MKLILSLVLLVSCALAQEAQPKPNLTTALLEIERLKVDLAEARKAILDQSGEVERTKVDLAATQLELADARRVHTYDLQVCAMPDVMKGRLELAEARMKKYAVKLPAEAKPQPKK